MHGRRAVADEHGHVVRAPGLRRLRDDRCLERGVWYERGSPAGCYGWGGVRGERGWAGCVVYLYYIYIYIYRM